MSSSSPSLSPSPFWKGRKLFFYLYPEGSKDGGTIRFFLKPGPTSPSQQWWLEYEDPEDLMNTVFQLSSPRFPSPESVAVHTQSFFAFLETQIEVAQAVVAKKFPSLELYYEDIIPIQLPTQLDGGSPFLWSKFYHVSNSITLSEVLSAAPAPRRYIPEGLSNFAIEFMLRHQLNVSSAMDWIPTFQLRKVPLGSKGDGGHYQEEPETLERCYVLCSRDFAIAFLKPWVCDEEVHLINRRNIVRQIEWQPPRQLKPKVHLFVVVD